MLEQSIEAFQPIPPAAVARVLGAFDRHQLAGFIEVAIGLLDVASGDPDLEDGGDTEPDCGGKGDQAWIEWHTMRGSQKSSHNLLAGQEDDEDDDPAEESGDEHDTDNAEDDELSGAALQYAPVGPGCEISDPRGGVDDDGERQQMRDDVPMLPVYTLDYNVFNDKRMPLGIGNLMASFVGRDVRSADTGKLHSRLREPDTPGSPV